ncbi:unnamed protein product, partial [Polarella glacialis]
LSPSSAEADALAKQLADPKPEVIAEAARALGNLGSAGDRYADHVASLLRWPDPTIRLAALEALGRFGKSAARQSGKIARLLSDANLQALGQVHAATHAPLLASLLQDASPVVQGAACLSLVAAGAGKAYVAAIAAKLDQKDTRFAATAALSCLPGDILRPYVQELVEKALSDGDSRIRSAALDVIGKVDPEEVLATSSGLILELLRHQDGAVRASAALCLGRLGTAAAAHAPEVAQLLADEAEDLSWLPMQVGGASSRQPMTTRKPRCAALVALGGLGAEAHVGQILELLEEDDWEVRFCALDALGNLGSFAHLHLSERTAGMLDDDTHPVRAKACTVLGLLGASDQLHRLSEMLDDKAQAVRAEAVIALGRLGPAAGAHACQVAELLADASNNVRGAAAQALAAMGSSGRPYASAVAQLLLDADCAVACQACAALGGMGEHGVIFAEDLEQVLEDRRSTAPEVCAAAEDALGLLGLGRPGHGEATLREVAAGGAARVPAVVQAALDATRTSSSK